MVDMVLQRFGHLDALVCNAGICLPGMLLQDVTPVGTAAVGGHQRRILRGPSRASPHDSPPRRTDHHCLLHVGPVGGACEVAYPPPRGAVIAFSKALAKEVAPSGITVNSVAPGVIDTDMMGFASQETRDLLAEETLWAGWGSPPTWRRPSTSWPPRRRLPHRTGFGPQRRLRHLTDAAAAGGGKSHAQKAWLFFRRSLSPRICPLPPKSAGWVPARAAGTTSC